MLSSLIGISIGISNKDQENILEKDSFTNKVYHEVANLSNSVVSVFQPLKKTLNRMSENVKEIFQFREESQLCNTTKK